MKKGFTLVEILIVIIISSMLIFTLSLLFIKNFSIFGFITYEKGVNDHLRNVENIIYDAVSNSEELQLLDNIPASFEDDYNYIYSKDGEVYYRKKFSNEINITENAEEKFEIFFTKKSNEVLSVAITPVIKSNHSKKTEIRLRNKVTEIQLESNTTTNAIKFASNLPEVLEVEITKFDFEKSKNDNTDFWTLDVYKGTIDKDNNVITVLVDDEVDISKLKPTVKHDGDETIKLNGVAEENQQLDCRNIIYAEVSKNGTSRKYEVVVMKKGIPQIVEFGFRAIDNTHVVGGDNSIIPLSGIKTNADGFNNGYRDGTVEPVLGKDKMGYIQEDTKEIFVSLDTIQGANQELVPYLKIKGDSIKIGDNIVNGTPTSIDGISEVVFNYKVDFNPERTFTSYETAENMDKGNLFEPVVSGTNNQFINLKPQTVTVYESMADGTTKRMRDYKVYVSPYGYAGSVEKVDEYENRIFKGYVDEENLQIYLPFKVNGGNIKFKITHVGNMATLYGRHLNDYWYKTDFNDNKEVSEGSFTRTISPLIDYTSIKTLNVYNQDVYDRNNYIGMTNDDQYEMDKIYEVKYQDSGIFEFTYENTGVQNKYLYQDKVEAEIIHGGTQDENTLGNSSPEGEINITFPKNEYLDDMVATVTYMGEQVGNINSSGEKILQQSEVTENNIASYNTNSEEYDIKLKEYYVKSEVKTFSVWTWKYDYFYNRYKFNIIESPSPEIEFKNGNSDLIVDGSGNDAILEMPYYDYIKGVNRKEDTSLTEYRWCFVSNADDVKTGKTEVDFNYNGAIFDIQNYYDKIPNNGYIYGEIVARSETYTVDEEVYGGVRTEPIYTEKYEIIKEVDEVINLDYMIFANNVNITASSVGGGSGTIHANEKLYIRAGGDIPKKTLQTANELDYKNTWSNSTVIAHNKVEEVNTETLFNEITKKIESRINNSSVRDEGSKTITIGNSIWGNNIDISDITQDWIKSNHITLNSADSLKSGTHILNVAAEKIKIKSSLNELAPSNQGAIIYHKGESILDISGTINTFEGLIFAPKATVKITAGMSNFKGAIYAEEVIIDTDREARMEQIEKIE